MSTKVLRKSRSKKLRPEDLAERFEKLYGFKPGGQGMMRQMEQAKVHNTVDGWNDECDVCIGQMRRIIQPYADANNAETWKAPRLLGFHYLQAKALDDYLDKLGRKIVIGTNLAKKFGFEVKPASFYGDSDTRLSIHREVEKIIAKVHQAQ